MDLLATQPASPLSEREKKLLTSLEVDIEQNLKGFQKVGYALATIRDQALFREEYDTFEEYCREEWDLGRPRAYQLIASHVVMENLSTIVDKARPEPFSVLPVNEAQARPLSYLPPEQQIEVWEMVLEEADTTESRITASFIQHCIDSIRQKKISNTIRKARESSEGRSFLPQPVQLSFQTFLDELRKNTDEGFEPESRKELAKLLREILSTIEN